MSSVPNAARKVLVSTMKTEGPYLLEWLAYHTFIGITDFCIFSNDCTDGTNLMVNRLDQMGIVKHVDNPLGPRMDPQRAAYSRAGKMDWVRAADWVLIVYADEVLNIHVGDRSVDALIDACGAPDAISVNRRLMGDKYLQEGWRGNADNVTNKFAQVNHYAIKSRKDFLLKRLRGTPNSKNKDPIDMEYWDEYDINSIKDTTITTDGIRAQMDEWLKDGDLAALSRACADCSQRVLDYQLTVPEFRTFIDTGHFTKMKGAVKTTNTT